MKANKKTLNEFYRLSGIKPINEVLGILEDGPAPLFKENGIEIYDIKDVETAIELGKDTNWAISKPGNQMFRAYIENGYKVFFVCDENKSGSPLEKVGIMISESFDKEAMVVDKNDGQHDFNTYMSYLKSVGVPIQMLK